MKYVIGTNTPICPYSCFLPETRWWLLEEYMKLWLEAHPKGVIIFDDLPQDVSLIVASNTGLGEGRRHPNLRGIFVGADNAYEKMPSWFQSATGMRDIDYWISLGGVGLN